VKKKIKKMSEVKRRRRKKQPDWKFQGRKLKIKPLRSIKSQPSAEDEKFGKKLNGTVKSGLQNVRRKKLNRIAKKYKVNTFQKTNKQIIEELHEIAKTM